MKILIVYMSYHHMNTEKIARAMAEVTGATLSKADEVDPGDLAGYDLIGFGSGIYGGKHHTSILALAADPTNPSTLYAGTYYGGICKSTDGGGTWRPRNAV